MSKLGCTSATCIGGALGILTAFIIGRFTDVPGEVTAAITAILTLAVAGISSKGIRGSVRRLWRGANGK